MYEHYSPHRFESHDGINQPHSSFQKLINRLTDLIFSLNIAIETGQGEVLVKTTRNQLKAEITNLVALKTVGLDPQSEEAQRLRSLTVQLFEAMSTGTMLRSIHKSDYLGLLALSLELAKEPKLVKEVVISTGFGGSDQDDINLRLPAYILPGLKMLENLIAAYKKNGLADASPTFRIFFAPHAAIRVNGAVMRSEIILRNLELSYQYLKQYIHQFHPQCEQHVVFQLEMPWKDHDPLTKFTLDYFSFLLLNSQDEKVVAARKVLRERGGNHGGEKGERLSAQYAAAHSLFFNDAPNHPGNVFSDKSKPLFAISIGGRPERLFNTVRTHIRSTGEVDELIKHAGNPGELILWQEEVKDARTTYGKDITQTKLHPSDRPLMSIPTLATVGSHPVYYPSPHDIGVHNICELPSRLLKQAEAAIANGPLSGQEKALEANRLKAIAHDIEALINDAGGEEQLLNFISSMQLSA